MEVFKYKKPLSLMSKAKRFSIVSVVLLLISIGLIFTKGFNLGIDFAGGTLVQIKYDKKAPIDEVRKLIEAEKEYKGASVTYFGTDNELLIRTKVKTKDLSQSIGDKFKTLLAPTGDFIIQRDDTVSDKIGGQFAKQGFMAMILAIIGILIYVSFRFEWRFAVASIMALVHDVVIAMGMIVLFSIEVNLDILAAILTILGYSLNDTIIVFDRIREGVNTIKDPKLEHIIDESVTRTLSRTTLTSLTTFFVVLTLFLFGGEIINGFSFTLLVGVVVGTYSSIFVASPILLWLGFSVSDYRLKAAKKAKREKEKEKMRAQYENGTL
ncbi:MAG: protein translocase subunit SecF [Campylobacterota bacterium]|nr:protein translocase subunit SecF [Campylobacterota bacterium]